MFESKYNKLLTVIFIIVIVAIIGLFVFLGFSYFNENNNTQEASDFVNDYTGDIIDEGDGTEVGDVEGEEGEEPEDGFDKLKDDSTGNTSSGTSTGSRTKKKTYKGFIVNGTMQIPKINFSYPVLDKVTKSSIENSVAVLYGAGLNQVGNTVIIGHNYRNGQFFSNNKKLSKGDKIYITDYEGNKKTYTIYNKFETSPEDTSFYQRDTNGKAEITLSTCTDDSSARLIIFARED